MANETIGIDVAETRTRERILKTKLRELLRTPGDREDLRIEYAADPVDQVKSSTDREMAVQRLNQQARLIHDIQAALAKIDEDTYGLCEDCEEPISRKRLDAVPWARLCIHCQSKAEAEGREQQPVFEHAA